LLKVVPLNPFQAPDSSELLLDGSKVFLRYMEMNVISLAETFPTRYYSKPPPRCYLA